MHIVHKAQLLYIQYIHNVLIICRHHIHVHAQYNTWYNHHIHTLGIYTPCAQYTHNTVGARRNKTPLNYPPFGQNIRRTKYLFEIPIHKVKIVDNIVNTTDLQRSLNQLTASVHRPGTIKLIEFCDFIRRLNGSNKFDFHRGGNRRPERYD